MRKVSRAQEQFTELNFRTAAEEDHYKYIHYDKNSKSWVITQKGTGKILSHHTSREKAIDSFKAMMMNKHSNVNLDSKEANRPDRSWMESMGGEPAVRYPSPDETERSFLERGESNGCTQCGTRIGEIRKLDEAFNAQSVSSEELRNRGLNTDW